MALTASSLCIGLTDKSGQRSASAIIVASSNPKMTARLMSIDVRQWSFEDPGQPALQSFLNMIGMFAGRLVKCATRRADAKHLKYFFRADVRGKFIVCRAVEVNGLAVAKRTRIFPNEGQWIVVEPTLPDLCAKAPVRVIKPVNTARMKTSAGRVGGGQTKRIIQIVIFRNRHFFFGNQVDLSQGTIGDTRQFHQWQMGDFKIRIRTQSDHAVEKFLIRHAETQRSKSAAGMAGDDSADALRRGGITAFNLRHYFFADR